MSNTKDSIVFVDEGEEYIGSRDFAAAVRDSDNYYVLFYRENLHELPYSVDEIYEIKTSGKFHLFKPRYPARKHIYSQKTDGSGYKVLLTEDSKAGYQFYRKYMEGKPVNCISVGSNGAIYPYLADNKNGSFLVIADGAAFGSEMNRIMELVKRMPGGIILCLPESFEWLILKSGLVHMDRLEDMLENPSNYIESGEYFSWEQFFTDYLIKAGEGKQYRYQKNNLNPYYLIPANMEKIVSEISAIKTSSPEV